MPKTRVPCYLIYAFYDKMSQLFEYGVDQWISEHGYPMERPDLGEDSYVAPDEAVLPLELIHSPRFTILICNLLQTSSEKAH